MLSMPLKLNSGKSVKSVEFFAKLRSEIHSNENDVNILIAKAWFVLNKIDLIWKSNLSNNLKRRFFQSTVEAVLMHNVWALTKSLESDFDGICIRMLRVIFNLEAISNIHSPMDSSVIFQHFYANEE